MSDTPLNRKQDISSLAQAGDWCLFTQEDGGRRVVMACPVCAGVFVAREHVIQSENPLTLSPSVVTPDKAPKPWEWEVLAPCMHHFS